MKHIRDDASRLPQWLLWLVGVATVLAAALMILAVVLGIRAGQRQIEIQARQQIGIHLQQAIDLRAEGDLDAALTAYQTVLVLDPGNVAAVEGIESLLRLAQEGSMLGQPAVAAQAPDQAPVTTPTTARDPVAQAAQAAAAVATSPLNAPAPTSDPLAAVWQEAQDLYSSGNWERAVDQLLALQARNSAYNEAQVADLLFNAYVNLAAENDQAGRLEEALSFVDKALALRPNTTALRSARTKAAAYLDMLSYYGVDWAAVIALLQELYEEDPAYRDVEERLPLALIAYGDNLMEEGDPCRALDQYAAAIEIDVQPATFTKRNTAREECNSSGGSSSAVAPRVTATSTLAGQRNTPTVSPSTAANAAPTAQDNATPAAQAQGVESDTSAPEAADAEESIAANPLPVAGEPTGQILYAAGNSDDGRSRIFAQTIGSGGQPRVVVEDGMQPAMRADGKRIVYYNTRSDMAGLSSFDPDSGLVLRFTTFGEDKLPAWNPEGNRVVFASNREGDRRWRIYVAWAEADGEVNTLGFGETADWHPSTDLIVFRGCDETGNGCGLWTMTGSGANRRSLTTTPADSNPVWTPDGRYVVFMSNGRHGNYELYRADTSTGEVLRLTDNPANDGIPAVSPDGNWVAFLSNRNGVWKIWGVPLAGGDAVELINMAGDPGSWLDQQIQWIE